MIGLSVFFVSLSKGYHSFVNVSPQVAVYQEKLRELEDRQSELVTENMELKELCLFLDQERVRMTGDRDEGDGSSNGTVTGHEDGIVSMETAASSTANTSVPVTNSYPISERLFCDKFYL